MSYPERISHLKRYVVADIGHSFVRRTTAAVKFPSAVAFKRRLHYDHDILTKELHKAEAAELATLHHLQDRVSHMYTMSLLPNKKSLALVSELLDNVQMVKDLDPDFVLVHIASNEISNMRGDLHEMQWKLHIRNLVDECRSLAKAFPPDITVCFMEVVPRLKSRGILMTAERFDLYSKYFNRLMAAVQKQALKNDPQVHPGFRYAKARGWRYQDVPGTSNCVEKPLGSMISRDEIHPSLETLRVQYSRCIQRAIKEFQNRPARLIRQ
jgi:hypothetical protein